MTRAAPLGLRLFLEGIEVPVIAAQVTTQPDSPAAAAIQIVPTDLSLHLLPRTLVHLFYLDPDAVQYPSDENEDNTNIEDDAVTLDKHYKVLFIGEIIGFNYSKTPTGRSMVLQCMDLSSYWDTCYQWFADYSVGGNGLTDKSHTFAGAGEGLFDNVASGHQWVIGNLLNSAPKSLEYRNCTGLLGGIIHLLESIGGIRWRAQTTYEGYNGVNDFFSIAELRYNLLGMIGAVEKDTTSAKMYAAKAFMNWLRNGMTSMGNLLSFRDILNHVNRYIFHNIYPNPSAKYQPPNANGTVTVNSTVTEKSIRGSPAGQAGLRHLNVAMEETLNGSGIAGAIWSSTSTDLKGLQNKIDIAKIAAKNAGEYFDKTGYTDAPKIKADLQAAIAAYDATTNGLKAEATPIVDRGETAFNNLRQAYESLKKALQSTRQVVKKAVKVEVGGRLFNQLIMPETIFMAPPRCNVLFPDQYFSLSYARNYMREPTRLALQVGLGILAGARGSHLLDRFYYAPSTRDVYGKLLFTTMSEGGRVLLPHETHSGIIPRFEWVTDGHRWGVEASRTSGATDDMYAAGKIGYLQRLANLQFFIHRWQARSLAISGVFNPRVVLGLPLVVMDKALPPSVVKAMTDKLGKDYLPTQFIGKVVSLNHSVSQEGGTTNYGLSYVRTHRGLDDEFLGVLVREQSGLKKLTKKFRTDDVITSTASYKGERDTFIKIINIYIGGALKNAFIKDFGATVTDMTLGPLISFEYEIAKRAGIDIHKIPRTVVVGGQTQPGKIQLPSTFELKLSKKVGEATFIRGALAPEDALMPAWYDDVWRKKDPKSPKPKNISDDVYMPLLGTRAITDDQPLDQAAQQDLLKKQADETLRESTGTSGEAVPSVNQVPGGLKIVVPTGSIEEAIDGLALIYGLLKEKNADVHEFINDYTYREIATMKQILGDRHLEFNETGRVKDPTTMTEGFHSRSFGDYNTDVKDVETETTGGEPQEPTPGKGAMNLFFVGKTAFESLSIARPLLVDRKGGQPSKLKPYLDPRGRAAARVQAYMKELRASRGLFGV